MNGDSFSDIKESQTAAFERFLTLMVSRRQSERTRDCGIVFSENPPDDGGKALTAAARADIVLATTIERSLGGDADSILQVPVGHGEADRRDGGDESDRYLQFAFMKHTFYMDLPRNTLFVPEARNLMTQRSGFSYLKNRRWPFMSFKCWQHDVQEWNPVQKEFLNSDTHAAAQDMAFILFTLWKFPVDWDFHYRALCFGSRKRKWEGTGRVE